MKIHMFKSAILALAAAVLADCAAITTRQGDNGKMMQEN